MPCYVDPVPEHIAQNRELKYQVGELENKSNFHEAIACMLMRHLLEDCDFPMEELNSNLHLRCTESGISQQKFTEWWKTHQTKDQERLKAEMISGLKSKLDSLSSEQLTQMVAILKNG